MQKKVVLDDAGMERALVRIAHEIVERNPDQSIAIVGIHRRGVPIAHRLVAHLETLVAGAVAYGEIDISFYRDDIGSSTRTTPAPVVHGTQIDFPLEGHAVVIVDDVLFTGRTVRAAIEELFDYGRPERVQLAVLVDRGHRELPIRPDFIGKNLPTSLQERVAVKVKELDGADEVVIVKQEPEGVSQ